MNKNSKNSDHIVNQLRLDKIIYAVEAIAINTLCGFLFFASELFLQNMLKSVVQITTILIALGYTIYMGVGNYQRLQKIRQIEAGE